MRWAVLTEIVETTDALEMRLLESRALGLIIPTYFLPARYAVRPGRGYYF
jgi:hypothetical protein